jgi:hypothetical protein
MTLADQVQKWVRNYNDICLRGRMASRYNIYFVRKIHCLNRVGRILLGFGEYTRRTRFIRQLPASLLYPTERFACDGYCQIQPDNVLLTELLQACQQRLEQATSFESTTGKQFFCELLKPEDYALDSVFMRFALDERILATVAEYLGTTPFLESISLLHSKPADPKKPISSQRWHRDNTDKSIMKVFVYINDVSPEEGPLTILPLTASRKVPSYLEHYLSDTQLTQYVPTSAVVPLMGPAGTTFLVDTNNCFHFGSRCTKMRLAFVVYYTTGFGYFSRVANHQEKLKDASGNCLSPLQMMALGSFSA